MNNPLQQDLLKPEETTKIADTITDRLSQELIIALVGPIASGVSSAAGYLRDVLVQEFSYLVAPIIKPSDVIKGEMHRVGLPAPARKPLAKYIDKMQTAGNELRAKFGPNYLAEKVVEKIVQFRHDNNGYSADGKILLPGRRAYIIDSIKNGEELDLLRSIYGETMCMIGVFAPDGLRQQRLKDDGIEPEEIRKVIDRDQEEVVTFGQKTRKVFVQADFLICNDQKKDELRRRIVRYLHILFGTEIHTPTRAESAMYEANAAAADSACMSRQVGAAIVSKSGELISVGWNDVPKFRGGLYSEDDQSVLNPLTNKVEDKDHRCFKWGQRICHNEVRRNSILDAIAKRFVDSEFAKRNTSVSDVRIILAGTEIDSLIEFSRSIHAEMEAILAVAREGRHSLVGATLFTTTYPCHNCARHIVAAGISTVFYIQPYAKSLAIALHNDAVTEDPNDQTCVVFRQYDGVAPRQFLRLFASNVDRKKDGKLLIRNQKTAFPVFRVPLDSAMEYESKIIADLSVKEQSKNTVGNPIP